MHAEVPRGVTTIGGEAFLNCKSLVSITFPDTLTSIGPYAFISCGLQTLVLPHALTDIQEGAFCNCPLRSVQYRRPVSLVYIAWVLYKYFSGWVPVRIGPYLLRNIFQYISVKPRLVWDIDPTGWKGVFWGSKFPNKGKRPPFIGLV